MQIPRTESSPASAWKHVAAWWRSWTYPFVVAWRLFSITSCCKVFYCSTSSCHLHAKRFPDFQKQTTSALRGFRCWSKKHRSFLLQYINCLTPFKFAKHRCKLIVTCIQVSIATSEALIFILHFCPSWLPHLIVEFWPCLKMPSIFLFFSLKLSCAVLGVVEDLAVLGVVEEETTCFVVAGIRVGRPCLFCMWSRRHFSKTCLAVQGITWQTNISVQIPFFFSMSHLIVIYVCRQIW